MLDLLLITDVPRLGKLFARLTDEGNTRLRVASSLEKGAEELLAEKPALVFLQAHLSGLSPEILLMHLKKQLGRRRTRFVLLSSPDQASEETLKLYHGHVDTSLEDGDLLEAVRALITAAPAKSKKAAVITPAALQAASLSEAEPAAVVSDDAPAPDSQRAVAPVAPLALVAPEEEPSLAEQGVVYAPRPKLSVYSEFTSSFDNAVASLPPAQSIPPQEDPVGKPVSAYAGWDEHPDITDIEPATDNSRRNTFLLWLAPVLVAVVVVTVLQQRRPSAKSVDVAPAAPSAKTAIDKSASNAGAVPAPAPAAVPQPAAAPAPVVPKPAPAESDVRLSDRAMLTAIAENRAGQQKAAAPAKQPFLTELPDFIPRAGLDKGYAAANPGWERYKGQVTEFKIYREGKAIKAIQIIDRGGKGVPESFMKAALKQLTPNPAFVMASSETKEGYEIQRGKVSEHLKVVYYRDAQGGRLRAFVVNWL